MSEKDAEKKKKSEDLFLILIMNIVDAALPVDALLAVMSLVLSAVWRRVGPPINETNEKGLLVKACNKFFKEIHADCLKSIYLMEKELRTKGETNE